MADISHQFGQDVSFGASGDLQLVGGSPATVQRILRRLLTNPGDYIWHPEYGAGIGRYVGETLDEAAIEGAIQVQMSDEAAVSQDPPPAVQVTSSNDGSVFVAIQYVDEPSGQPQSIQFAVSA